MEKRHILHHSITALIALFLGVAIGSSISKNNSILVNLYYLAGVFSPFVGLLVIFQIVATANDIKLRNSRQEINLAVEALRRSSIELHIKLSNVHKITGYRHYVGEISTFRLDSLPREEERIAREFYDRNVEKVSELLNEIELFAIAFIDGTANKDIGRRVNGPAFIRLVKENYHFICIARNEESTVYQSVVDLYRAWKDMVQASSSVASSLEQG